MNRFSFIFLFLSSLAYSQTIINADEFKKIDGIVLIEFWADWNKSNECKWVKNINGIDSYRMTICSSVAKDLDIKVIPTLVLYDKKQPVGIWEADISFTLSDQIEENVQEAINKLKNSKKL